MKQNDLPVHAIQLLGLILDLGASLMESYRTATPDVCVGDLTHDRVKHFLLQ